MKIKQLMPVLLCLAPLALCGCLSRSEASPSPSPVGASPDETGAPTILVAERDPLTPVEVALGLDYEVSETTMLEIAERVRNEGSFGGQSCGMGIGEDGKPYGAFGDYFSINLTGDKAEGVKLGYLQKDSVPLNSVRVDGYMYRLRNEVFHREKLPER